MARDSEAWFRTNHDGLLGEIRAIVRRIDNGRREPTQAEVVKLAELRANLHALRRGKEADATTQDEN